MCGIVGIIAAKKEPSLALKRWLWQAIYANSFRGFDSTGLMTPDGNGAIDVFKKAIPGPDFLENKYAAQMVDNPGWFAVAHNRAATRGKVENKNAHPFQIDDITLVHNGTVNNGYQLAGKYHEVDSEAICAGLAARPASVAEYIGKIDGAYALVWHDRADDTLYFVRNKERPLGYGITDEGDVMIASELPMLQWLAWRNNLKIVKADYISEDTIFAIKRGNEGITREEIPVKKPQPLPLVGWGAIVTTKENNLGGQKSTDSHSNASVLKLMKDFDIKMFENVRFLKHVPYNSGPMGTLVGHLSKSPYHEVQIGGVAYNEIQRFLNQEWSIRVTNVFTKMNSRTGELDPIVCTHKDHIAAPRSTLKLVGPAKKEEDKSTSTPPVVVNRSIYFNEAGECTSYKKWQRIVREAHGKCYNCGNIVDRRMAKRGKVEFIRVQEELCAICPACVKELSSQADASGTGAMVH